MLRGRFILGTLHMLARTSLDPPPSLRALCRHPKQPTQETGHHSPRAEDQEGAVLHPGCQLGPVGGERQRADSVGGSAEGEHRPLRLLPQPCKRRKGRDSNGPFTIMM